MLYYNVPSAITINKASAFAFQYFFENHSIYIVEIRRNDLPLEDVSVAYQWLVSNKANLKVTPLNIRSVDSSSAVEERFFDEGYLKFTNANATFIEKYNSAQHNLTQTPTISLPSTVNQAIADFIIA